ncbi:hypothetical protein CHS0354_032421 [Potamilus streckersoni]|uniref:Uncharacterized protein n=1 Tax=Potamilus streckersoni TaxID=2493646 RepID=A0AAE0SQQ3_9BIVA|nr:hypothetical protein CHS0354_032421 [Potamilus streckersoni]
MERRRADTGHEYRQRETSNQQGNVFEKTRLLKISKLSLDYHNEGRRFDDSACRDGGESVSAYKTVTSMNIGDEL